MEKAIYFDMDGTIADLYGAKDWLQKIQMYDVEPYEIAHGLVHMSTLARMLNKLQKQGWHIGIVSWLSKGGTDEYGKQVDQAKREWLNTHLKSVQFDEIKIVAHGTPKGKAVQYEKGILFDDEENNRTAWKGQAYDEKKIIEILKNLLKNA